MQPGETEEVLDDEVNPPHFRVMWPLVSGKESAAESPPRHSEPEPKE